MKDFSNYHQETKTIDMVLANVVALVILFVSAILFALPFMLIWGASAFKPDLPVASGYYFLLFVIGIVLHELIHGLCFALFAQNGFRSIRFGVMWKMLTPYCHCKEPLKVKHYVTGALMPAILLGLVPILRAFFTGSAFCLAFGIFFIAAAAGDFMVVWMLRKENRNDYVQDHPTEAGCRVYRKKENELLT